jgi:hypothetical protein
MVCRWTIPMFRFMFLKTSIASLPDFRFNLSTRL